MDKNKTMLQGMIDKLIEINAKKQDITDEILDISTVLLPRPDFTRDKMLNSKTN